MNDYVPMILAIIGLIGIFHFGIVFVCLGVEEWRKSCLTKNS